MYWLLQELGPCVMCVLDSARHEWDVAVWGSRGKGGWGVFQLTPWACDIFWSKGIPSAINPFFPRCMCGEEDEKAEKAEILFGVVGKDERCGHEIQVQGPYRRFKLSPPASSFLTASPLTSS